jgi:hypothetical protein
VRYLTLLLLEQTPIIRFVAIHIYPSKCSSTAQVLVLDLMACIMLKLLTAIAAAKRHLQSVYSDIRYLFYTIGRDTVLQNQIGLQAENSCMIIILSVRKMRQFVQSKLLCGGMITNMTIPVSICLSSIINTGHTL